MVYFMLAFSYQVFTTTSTVVLATTASACGIVVVLTLWVIYAARVFHVLTWLLMLLSDWYFRAGQAIRSIVYNGSDSAQSSHLQ